MNNMWKKTAFCLVLAVMAVLLAGAAFADGGGRVAVWRLTELDIDAETLLDETFDRKAGNGTPDILEEQREYSSRFWHLKGVNGVPFCGISHGNKTVGIQIWVDIFRRSDLSEKFGYYYGLGVWNSIPEESGFSAERAAETCDQAADLLKRLGLYGEHFEPKPVSFTTLGSMEGATKCRTVVFEELLEGLPVRWSAEALYFADNGAQAYRNYAEVVYSDEEGLLKMEAYWCAFEPESRADKVLSREEAIERFASVGIRDTDPEACWFLSSDGKEAKAVLAWRSGMFFLSAVDGTWLQVEE